MARIFVIEGKRYTDPDPALTVDEVRQSMVALFPELANSETKESKEKDDQIIEFKKRVGVKG